MLPADVACEADADNDGNRAGVLTDSSESTKSTSRPPRVCTYRTRYRLTAWQVACKDTRTNTLRRATEPPGPGGTASPPNRAPAANVSPAPRAQGARTLPGDRTMDPPDTTAPLFGGNGDLAGAAAAVDLERFLNEDCFAANEWALLNDTLAAEALEPGPPVQGAPGQLPPARRRSICRGVRPRPEGRHRPRRRRPPRLLLERGGRPPRPRP